MRQSGDVHTLKQYLGRTEDKARLAYGHETGEFARQFVIIGTTNEAGGYLRDATGNRRFWPVRVQSFDLDRLRADRDQLWAEAPTCEAAGGSIRLAPSLYEDAALEQEVRTRRRERGGGDRGMSCARPATDSSRRCLCGTCA